MQKIENNLDSQLQVLQTIDVEEINNSILIGKLEIEKNYPIESKMPIDLDNFLSNIVGIGLISFIMPSVLPLTCLSMGIVHLITAGSVSILAPSIFLMLGLILVVLVVVLGYCIYSCYYDKSDGEKKGEIREKLTDLINSDAAFYSIREQANRFRFGDSEFHKRHRIFINESGSAFLEEVIHKDKDFKRKVNILGRNEIDKINNQQNLSPLDKLKAKEDVRHKILSAKIDFEIRLSKLFNNNIKTVVDAGELPLTAK